MISHSRSAEGHLDLLAALRDVVAARAPADVESATLAAARSLLGADAAFWLDLVDGALRMTAIAGFAQPESHVQSIVPPGAGLSAEIVAGDVPVATEDYGADARAVDTFASLFGSEGIISAAGAPIRSPDGVVGVLYVFTRHSRRFSDKELQVLVSIAGIARMLREWLRERDDLALHVELELQRARATDRLHRATDALTLALLRGQPLASGLEAASDELGVRIHVEGLPRPGKPTTRAALPEDPPDVPVGPYARIPGADLAVLLAEGELPEGHLESLARLIGIDFHRQRAQVETEIRLTDQFVHSLFAGDTPELERIWQRATLLGMNPAVPRVIVSFGRDTPADRALLDRIQREMQSRTSGGQVTTYDGEVILLWPLPTESDEQQLRGHVESIIAACRPQRLTAGIGSACRTAADYPAAVREAMFARAVAVNSTADKTIVTVAELGMYRLFAHVGGMDALRSAVLETLGPLIQADARDGSDLVNTLRAYLERDRRIAETARALHLHVNTLRYRVDRIGRILHADFDDPEIRFFTLLALRLRGVVG